MTSNRSRTFIECEEFQRQLPEIFDSGQDLLVHRHMQSCQNCSSLVRDLEYIAAQAKLLLPIHDPSPAVWENIHNALTRQQKDDDKSS
ncbi:MAG: hypothetical protein ACYCPM_01825 [Acidobacteriaceae bacterium]